MTERVDYLENFRHNLRLLRQHRKYSRAELARRAGITPQYIATLESGDAQKSPSLEKLVKIANALGTTPGKLLEVKSSTDLRKYIREKFS